MEEEIGLRDIDRDYWEYLSLQFNSMSVDALTKTLNDAGARGWELVSMTNNDKMIGLNSIVALMRRIVPFPPPEDLSSDWKPDPSGRFNGRYWDGECGMFRVMTDGEESRDPPTQLTPAKSLSRRSGQMEPERRWPSCRLRSDPGPSAVRA